MRRWGGLTSYLACKIYNLHLNESVLRLAYRLLRKSEGPRFTARFYRASGKLLVKYLMWAQALVVDGAEPEHEHQLVTPTAAKQLLAEQEKIGVIDCLCRQVENRCNNPRETCLLFGQEAESYVKSSRGRWLALKEAQGLIDDCQKAGLVQNAIIARDEVMGICSCCRCCCLAIIGTHFQIDSVRSSGYVARLVGNNCAGCKVCSQVCPFGAINGEREISLERCRGCGLCVIKCPQNHISLVPFDYRSG